MKLTPTTQHRPDTGTMKAASTVTDPVIVSNEWFSRDHRRTSTPTNHPTSPQPISKVSIVFLVF
jgi:hypothetical protein